MLPMMILHELSEKPVFFGEVHTYRDNVLAVRHCAVPGNMASSPLILKRWRDKEGTVTGYCELPKGEVTILNSGAGDKMISLTGEVLETRDLGGDNCRVTVYIEIKDDDLVRKFYGREIAMAYGDYTGSVADVGNILGIKVN